MGWLVSRVQYVVLTLSLIASGVLQHRTRAGTLHRNMSKSTQQRMLHFQKNESNAPPFLLIWLN